jgi:hypothetical protein
MWTIAIMLLLVVLVPSLTPFVAAFLFVTWWMHLRRR